MEYELFINNEGSLYFPQIEEGIEWHTERAGVPGKLIFNVVKDDIINFSEGNHVTFRVNGKKVFYGFVFTKKRDKNGVISVTAYDQLRYLKNKDVFIYERKKACEVIQLLASRFNLQLGDIEDTGYTIPTRVEDNVSLFDIIQTALDLTLTNTTELFVLYDDFGKLTLKNIANMKTNVVIDKNSTSDFIYSSTIDSNTYNQIKVVYPNNEEATRDIYIEQDTENMNKWGVLQYLDNLKEEENGVHKAKALLALYNKKTRTLKVSGVMGHLDVRAGSLVLVKLELGDIVTNNYMIVERCIHVFKENEHIMELTLRGGDITA